MRKVVYLLLAAALLYLVPSLILEAVYGPSYGFLSGEDCWMADGEGGWVRHGNPDHPPPQHSSVNVPAYARGIPVVLPIMLLTISVMIWIFRARHSRQHREIA